MLAACNPLITPEGILYVNEVFTRNGLSPVSASKSAAREYSLINRNGEPEITSKFTYNGRRPVYAVRTATGNRIVATAKHRNLIMNDFGFWVWKEQQTLRPGNYLVTSRKYATAIGQRAEMPDKELYFLGILLADGAFSENRIAVTNNDPVIKESIVSDGAALLGVEPHQYTKRSEGSLDFHFNSQEAARALYEKTGWAPGVAKDKHLGSMIRQLNTNQMRWVLQGYFDCECSIDKSGIEVTSASWKLLFEVKTALLTHFGIISNLNEMVVAAYPQNEYWRLYLYGQSARDYLAQVGFRSEIRNREADAIDPRQNQNPNVDVVRGCGPLLEALNDSSETTEQHSFAVRDYKGVNPKANPGYHKLSEILALPWAEGAPLQRLVEIAHADYFYDEVVSVEKMEPEATFDFVLPMSNTFNVANVITHASIPTQTSAVQDGIGELAPAR